MGNGHLPGYSFFSNAVTAATVYWVGGSRDWTTTEKML